MVKYIFLFLKASFYFRKKNSRILNMFYIDYVIYYVVICLYKNRNIKLPSSSTDPNTPTTASYKQISWNPQKKKQHLTNCLNSCQMTGKLSSDTPRHYKISIKPKNIWRKNKSPLNTCHVSLTNQSIRHNSLYFLESIWYNKKNNEILLILITLEFLFRN